MLTTKQKEGVIKKFAAKDNDTGSVGVQIALLSKRIDELAIHLKNNKKDVHSRRGLLQMVADRRAHLVYLKKHNPKKYSSVTKQLGLKHK